MMSKPTPALDILCRELQRLQNDADRLQMLVTLKSRLSILPLNSETLRLFFSAFNDEQHRLQAIDCLLLAIYKFITPDSVTVLLQLFTTSDHRRYLLEMLKSCELLKTNSAVHETVLHEYRQYFHVEAPIETVKKAKSTQNVTNLRTVSVEKPTLAPSSSQPLIESEKVLSSTSGVFEKAKQFVCRVFGGGSSSITVSEEQHQNSRKRSAAACSLTDSDELKKMRASGDPLKTEAETNTWPSRVITADNHAGDLQHPLQPTTVMDDEQTVCLTTSFPLNISRSYASITTKSPPPSPVTPQSVTSLTENILSQLDTTIRKHVNEQNNGYQETLILRRQTSMSFHVPDLANEPEDSSTVLSDEVSLPIQPFMLTRIHSVLDNIDSVLDRMEAQTNSAVRRPAFNENYHTQTQDSTSVIASVESNLQVSTTTRSMSSHADAIATDEMTNVSVQQQGTDQITQTPPISFGLAQAALSIVAHRLGTNGGGGDSSPTLIDMLDIVEESRSTLSSESDSDEELFDDLELEDDETNWIPENDSHRIFDDQDNNNEDDSL